MASGDECDCNCLPKRIASIKRCTPQNPHALIRKLVELLEDPMTDNLYDRHYMILNEFLDVCTYAFWVQDLPYVMRLLELLIKRLDIVCLYKKPLEALLSLCAVPPMLFRASDTIQYSRDLQEYFTFLGYLIICIHEETLQDLVFQALTKLLNRKAPAEISCITLKTCHEVVEASDLPKIICQLMEIAEENTYVKVLDVALILVKISPRICQTMIKERVIDHLLIRLDQFWKTSHTIIELPDPKNDKLQNIEITSKLLWALLNSLKQVPEEFKKTIASPCLNAIWNLRRALQVLTKKKRNELNRNHIMGILLQCIGVFSDMRLLQSGLADDITILSMATEMGTEGTWASGVHFPTNELNYEFKKMLLLALCYCARIRDALKGEKIIPALLKIITPECSTAWLPQQHKKLISLTLHTLQVLAARFPTDFLYFNGPLRLLILVDFYNVEPYDIHILQDCLQTLSSITIIKSNDILLNLLVNDAQNILYSLSENLLSNEILTLNIQRCLAYAFATLEVLCHTHHASETNTVNLLMTFMKRIIHPNPEDTVHDPKFLICAIGYLWENVVWSNSNLKIFVSNGGIFEFLDLIQKSVFPVQVVALGALVDMCDEGSCVPHLITWRKNGQKLLSMLLQLFRDENKNLGVKTAPNGTIQDIEMPIIGQQQWYETFYENKEPNSSPATVDLLGSCRPKIYAIIQLLNDRHQIRADIINEQYCLYDYNNLNTQDQLTLLLAENFLALKLGETWVELRQDLEKTGIRPLAVDAETIASLNKRFYKWAHHIKTVQEALLAKETENECRNERLLYNTLKESKLTESLKALHQLDYMARTTERMFRLIRKMTQTSELEHSLAFTDGADHHRTCMYTIKVNPVFNQEVSIQSNIIIDPNNTDFDLRPVSPSTDEDIVAEQSAESEIESICSEI